MLEIPLQIESIIVMTGYAEIDGEDILGAERLTKPFDRRDLAAALARVTA